MTAPITHSFDPTGRNLLIEPGEADRQWETVAKGDDSLWGKDGFGFDDFVDMINPLQHIPIIGSIYRAVTGDNLEPGARLIGGVLFGGPIGFASAMLNTIVEKETGGDLGENVIAMVSGKQLNPPGTDPAAAKVKVAKLDNKTAIAANPASLPARQADKTNAQANTIGMLPNIAAGKTMFLPKNSAANLGKFQTPTAAARSNALGAGQDHKQGAMRAATGQTQRLSPKAFDALMKSLGAVKMDPSVATKSAISQKAAKNAVASTQANQLQELLQRRRPDLNQQLTGTGAKQLPILKGDAAMELHRLLKNHAQKSPLPRNKNNFD